jgi:hypothetical protein
MKKDIGCGDACCPRPGAGGAAGGFCAEARCAPPTTATITTNRNDDVRFMLVFLFVPLFGDIGA